MNIAGTEVLLYNCLFSLFIKWIVSRELRIDFFFFFVCVIICVYGFAEANMLYLETPIGVGFSYSSDSSFNVTVNDKITGMSPQCYPKLFSGNFCKKK